MHLQERVLIDRNKNRERKKERQKERKEERINIKTEKKTRGSQEESVNIQAALFGLQTTVRASTRALNTQSVP
jgi:hypothetical protein